MQLYYTRKLSSPESSAVTDLENLTENVIVFCSNASRKYKLIYEQSKQNDREDQSTYE